MKTIAIYLFQMIACSGILYGYYHFFLRNKKFHHYNRYFLLVSMAISLLVPFLKIPVYISGGVNSVQKALLDYNYYMMPEVVVTSSSKNGVINWEIILVAFYAAIMLFLISRIYFAIARLVKLRINNSVEKLGKITFIETSEGDAPFSFFNWIFWNNKIDSYSDEGQHIMKHELYHVNQKHSLDVLFMETVCALVWMNPFYYLMKKEIKAIHEFLADDYAAGNEQKLQYAEILVLQAIGSCKQQLVNPFFNNQLKRRINMLTTNKKPGNKYLTKLLALPVLALISVLFIVSCKSNDANSDVVSNDSVKITEVTIADSNGNLPAARSHNSDSVKVTEVTINDLPGPEIFSKVDIDAAYPGGAAAWKNLLETSLRAATPVNHGAKPGTYTTIIQFIVDKEGNVSDVKPLTDIGFGMEEESVRVIKMSGKWKPAMQNGREVKAYRKQPITFVVIDEKKDK